MTHTLDPLISPLFAEQDKSLQDAFNVLQDDRQGGGRDYLRGFKRCSTYAIDWAGDHLLISTKDNYLRLYDPQSGHEVRSWQGECMSMQCDPQTPHIAAAVSWNGKLRVFDTRVSQSYVHDVDLKKSNPNFKEFLCMCWSPDSRYIAVNNRADQIYLLDLKGGISSDNAIRLGPSISMPQEVNQMVWGPGGETLWIATGGTPGKIYVYPAPSLAKETATSVAAHQYTTISLAADPGNNVIASGGGDCLVTLWDPRHLVCTRTFGYATQAVTTLGLNHDGSLLAWGTGVSGNTGGEKNLTIVGTDTGSLYWQDSTASPVTQVRWHPKRNVLAYTLNVAQLPDERDARRLSNRDLAVVHTMTVG